MGMSAGQARLLSITARLTDNELRSQLITNSKLRLADKSGEASTTYMQSLNRSELTYLSYDKTGNRLTENLTAGLMMNYGELKTQYGLVNSSGQLMVTSLDKNNFETSATLADYLDKYSVPLTDNPKFAESLNGIFGKDYAKFIEGCKPDEDASEYINKTVTDSLVNSANPWVGGVLGTIPEISADGIVTDGGYQNWYSQMTNGASNGWFDKYKNSLGGKAAGTLGQYMDKVSSPPVWDFGNQPIRPEKPNIGDVWDLYKNTVCLDSVGGNPADNFKIPAGGRLDTFHAEHSLCHAIHNAFESGTFTVYPGTSKEATFSFKGGASSNGSLNESNGAYSPSDEGTYQELRDALANYPDINQSLLNLYYEIARVECISVSSGNSLNNNGTPKKTGQELAVMWNEVMDMLSGANADDIYDEMLKEYDEQMKAWEASYNSFKSEVQQWKSQCEGQQKALLEEIQNLPPQEVADKNDPKYEWYKNLWYRMGGISESKKTDNTNGYKELESEKMNSSEWLQFALEHGILSLEQVTFNENGSDKFPNIGTVDWTSLQYKNAADISTQQSDLAIAKAEIKYKNALNEIERQDKKFDQDLKKLDTAHSALQTEYDSVKGVIDKNIERSFKAFS